MIHINQIFYLIILIIIIIKLSALQGAINFMKKVVAEIANEILVAAKQTVNLVVKIASKIKVTSV